MENNQTIQKENSLNEQRILNTNKNKQENNDVYISYEGYFGKEIAGYTYEGETIYNDVFIRKFWSINNMFSFKGRIRRREYWLYTLLCFGISALLCLTFIGIPVAVVFSMVMGASLFVRRLHDLDLSGWWYFLVFIPIVNIFFGIYVQFFKGNSGDNKYGPETIYKD